MSKHTPGEMVVNHHDSWIQWAGNLTIHIGKVECIMQIRTVACITKYGETVENIANAEEIARRWNSYPALLAACEALVHEIRPFASDNGPREFALDEALAAIAQARA